MVLTIGIQKKKGQVKLVSEIKIGFEIEIPSLIDYNNPAAEELIVGWKRKEGRKGIYIYK